MKFDMTGISVLLAMPTHRDIPPQTVVSLLGTQALLMQRGIRSTMEIQYGGSLPHHARTKLAWHFLQGEWSHLFWVDSDIVWKAEDFLRLLVLGTKLECVTGLYPCRSDPPKFFLGINETDVYTANEYGCIPVGGLGLGFTCVQRKVIQELAAKADLTEFPDVDEGPIPYIFECGKKDGKARGEDIAFFQDIKALGYKVWMDPTINLGHMGSKEYRASISDHLVSAAA